MSLAAQGRIPVLDIGAYLAGEAGAAAPLARAIARTCEDTGFFVVANHGVPQHLVDDTFAVAQQFFARPEGDKLALKIGTYNIGYLPFGGQVVRHSPVNKNTKPNFSESFYITRDRAPDHPDIVNEKPLVGLYRWPEDVPVLGQGLEHRYDPTLVHRRPRVQGKRPYLTYSPLPPAWRWAKLRVRR